MALHYIRPNAEGASTGWVVTGATTAWEAVNDDAAENASSTTPTLFAATPSYSTTDYVESFANNDNVVLELGAPPGDYTASGATLKVRTAAMRSNRGDDNDYLQISVLTGGTLLGTAKATTMTDGSYAVVEYTDAAWNALTSAQLETLQIELRYIKSSTGMPDANLGIRVAAVEVELTYTSGVAAQTVTATFGTVGTTSFASTVTVAANTVAATFGTVAVTAFASTVEPAATVAATFGTVTVSSFASTVTPAGATRTATFGTVATTSFASTVTAGAAAATVTATFGTVSVTSFASTVTEAANTRTASFGTVAVTSFASTVEPAATVAATFGTVAVTAFASTVTPAASTRTATFGTVVVTSFAVTVEPAVVVAATFGTVAVTGYAVSVAAGGAGPQAQAQASTQGYVVRSPEEPGRKPMVPVLDPRDSEAPWVLSDAKHGSFVSFTGSSGLSDIWTPSGRVAAANNGGTRSVMRQGPSARAPRLILPDSYPAPNSYPMVQFAVFNPLGIDHASPTYVASSTDEYECIALYAWTDSIILEDHFTGSLATVAVPGSNDGSDTFSVVGVVYSSTTSRVIAKNLTTGRIYDSGLVTHAARAPLASTGGMVGYIRDFDATYQFNGDLALAGVLYPQSPWTEAQMRQFVGDPFAMIRPAGSTPAITPPQKTAIVRSTEEPGRKPMVLTPLPQGDLAQGLCVAIPLAGTERPRDVLSGVMGTTPGVKRQTVGPMGPNLSFQAADNSPWEFADNLAQHRPTTEVTWAALYTYDGAHDAYGGIFSKPYTAGNPYNSYALYHHSTANNGGLGCSVAVGGTLYDTPFTNALPVGVPMLVVGRWRTGGRLQVRIYYANTGRLFHAVENGVTASGSLTYSTSFPLRIGATEVQTDNPTGQVDAAYVWTRYLSEAELVALAQDPWTMFRPERNTTLLTAAEPVTVAATFGTVAVSAFSSTVTVAANTRTATFGTVAVTSFSLTLVAGGTNQGSYVRALTTSGYAQTGASVAAMEAKPSKVTMDVMVHGSVLAPRLKTQWSVVDFLRIWDGSTTTRDDMIAETTTATDVQFRGRGVTLTVPHDEFSATNWYLLRRSYNVISESGADAYGQSFCGLWESTNNGVDWSLVKSAYNPNTTDYIGSTVPALTAAHVRINRGGYDYTTTGGYGGVAIYNSFKTLDAPSAVPNASMEDLLTAWTMQAGSGATEPNIVSGVSSMAWNGVEGTDYEWVAEANPWDAPAATKKRVVLEEPGRKPMVPVVDGALSEAPDLWRGGIHFPLMDRGGPIRGYGVRRVDSTSNTADYATGQVGPCLDFVNTSGGTANDLAQFGDVTWLDGLTALSMRAVVRFDALLSTDSTINLLRKDGTAVLQYGRHTDARWNGLRMVTWPGGTMTVGSSGPLPPEVVTGEFLDIWSTWESGKGFSLYVNGKKLTLDTNETTAGALANSAVALVFGGTETNTEGFDGQMALASFYPGRVVSAGEIAQAAADPFALLRPAGRTPVITLPPKTAIVKVTGDEEPGRKPMVPVMDPLQSAAPDLARGAALLVSHDVVSPQNLILRDRGVPNLMSNVASEVGRVNHYSGGDDRIVFTNRQEYEATKKLTLAAVLRTDYREGSGAVMDNGGRFIQRGESNSGDVNYSFMYLNRAGTGGGWAIRLKPAGGGAASDFRATNTHPTVGRWEKVVAVFDRPTVRLYQNGVLILTGSFDMDLDVNCGAAPDRDLYLGGWGGSDVSRTWVGEMALSYVDTERAWTEAEVKAWSADPFAMLRPAGSTSLATLELPVTVSATFGTVGVTSFASTVTPATSTRTATFGTAAVSSFAATVWEGLPNTWGSNVVGDLNARPRLDVAIGVLLEPFGVEGQRIDSVSFHVSANAGGVIRGSIWNQTTDRYTQADASLVADLGQITTVAGWNTVTLSKPVEFAPNGQLLLLFKSDAAFSSAVGISQRAGDAAQSDLVVFGDMVDNHAASAPWPGNLYNGGEDSSILSAYVTYSADVPEPATAGTDVRRVAEEPGRKPMVPVMDVMQSEGAQRGWAEGLTAAVVDLHDIVQRDVGDLRARAAIHKEGPAFRWRSSRYEPEQDSDESTLLVRWRWPSLPANYTVPGNYGFWNTSTDNQDIGFQLNNANDLTLIFRHNSTSSHLLLSDLVYPFHETWAITANRTQAWVYRNGVVQNNGSYYAALGTTLAADARNRLNSASDISEVDFMYRWNRKLSAEEIADIMADPYALVRPTGSTAVITPPQKTPVVKVTEEPGRKPMVPSLGPQGDLARGMLYAAPVGSALLQEPIQRMGLTKEANVSVAPGRYGPMILQNGAATKLSTSERPRLLPTVREFTFMLRFDFNAAWGTWQGVFGLLRDTANGSGCMIGVNGSNNLEYWTNSAGTNVSNGSGVTLAAGYEYHACFRERSDFRRWDIWRRPSGGNSSWELVRDGSVFADTSVWSPPVFDAGARFEVGGGAKEANFHAGYHWNRFLTDAEILGLREDPFAAFRPAGSTSLLTASQPSTVAATFGTVAVTSFASAVTVAASTRTATFGTVAVTSFAATVTPGARTIAASFSAVTVSPFASTVTETANTRTATFGTVSVSSFASTVTAGVAPTTKPSRQSGEEPGRKPLVPVLNALESGAPELWNGLQGLWVFDNAGTPAVRDHVTNNVGRFVTAGPPEWRTSDQGPAVLVPVATGGSRIEVLNHPTLAGTFSPSAMSFEFYGDWSWNNDARIISKQIAGGAGAAADHVFMFSEVNSGSQGHVPRLRLMIDGITYTIYPPNTGASQAPAQGQRVHVVATWDGIEGRIKFYYDGVLVDNQTNLDWVGVITADDEPIAIGNNTHGAATNQWDQKMLKVAVYDRVLLPTEVKQLADDPWAQVRPVGSTAVITPPQKKAIVRTTEEPGRKPMVPAVEPQGELARGLLDYWLLDERTGVARSLTRSTTDGVPSADVVRQPDREGPISRMVTDVGGLNCGAHSHHNFGSGDFTLAARIKPGTSGAEPSYAVFMSKGLYNTDGWYFQLDNDTTMLALAVAENPGGFKVVRSVINTVPANQWSTLVAVRRGAVVKLFVNGQEVVYNTALTNLLAITDSARNLYLGRYDDATPGFRGSMSMAGMWNRALTDGEIRQLALDPYAPARLAGSTAVITPAEETKKSIVQVTEEPGRKPMVPVLDVLQSEGARLGLANGLVYAVPIDGTDPFDLVTQKKLTKGTANNQVGPAGRGLKGFTTTGDYSIPIPESLRTSSQLTMVVVASSPTFPAENNVSLSINGGLTNSTDLVVLYAYDGFEGNGLRVYRDVVGNILNQNNGTHADGKVHVVGYLARSVSDHHAFVDGKRVIQNGGASADLLSCTQITLGRWNTQVDTVGTYYAAYVWDRALTDGEIALLGADPFILLRPAGSTSVTGTAQATPVAVAAGFDAVTVSSFASAVTVAASTRTATLGTVTVTSFASTVTEAASTRAASFGTVAVTSFASTVTKAANTRTASFGTVAVTSFATTVEPSATVAATFGSVAVTSFAAAVTKGSSTRTATLGTVTVTSFASAVSSAAIVAATFGTVAVTAFASTVTKAASTRAASFGTVAVTSFAATVEASAVVAAGFTSVTVTPFASTVTKAASTRTATFGAVAVTSFASSVTAAGAVTVGFNAVTVSSFPVAIEGSATVAATFGTVPVTSFTASVSGTATPVAASFTSVAVTSFAATVEQAATVAVSFTSVAVTSFASSAVETSRTVAASFGTVAVTSFATTAAETARTVAATLGTATVTSYAASISKAANTRTATFGTVAVSSFPTTVVPSGGTAASFTSVAVTSFASTVTPGARTISATFGTVPVTSFASTAAETSRTVAATLGTVAVASFAVTVEQAAAVTVGFTSVAISSFASTVAPTSRTVVAGFGTVAVTAFSSTAAETSRTVTATLGTASVTSFPSNIAGSATQPVSFTSVPVTSYASGITVAGASRAAGFSSTPVTSYASSITIASRTIIVTLNTVSVNGFPSSFRRVDVYDEHIYNVKKSGRAYNVANPTRTYNVKRE